MDSVTPHRLQKALSELKKRDVFITKSDKTNQFVIMDKTSYDEKLQVLLNDEQTYEKLTSDPLKRKAADFNKSLRIVPKDHPDLVTRFKCINPGLPYLYGLPKTHKMESATRGSSTPPARPKSSGRRRRKPSGSNTRASRDHPTPSRPAEGREGEEGKTRGA